MNLIEIILKIDRKEICENIYFGNKQLLKCTKKLN